MINLISKDKNICIAISWNRIILITLIGTGKAGNTFEKLLGHKVPSHWKIKAPGHFLIGAKLSKLERFRWYLQHRHFDWPGVTAAALHLNCSLVSVHLYWRAWPSQSTNNYETYFIKRHTQYASTHPATLIFRNISSCIKASTFNVP